MAEIAPANFLKNSFKKNGIEGLTGSVLVIVSTILLVFYLRYHWTRRKLYQLSANVPGPRGFPLIGEAYKLLGDSSAMWKNIMKTWEEYGDLIKVWFGPRLIYGVSKPEHIEIVLNNCLQKDTLIDFMQPLLGTGIFTARVDKWKKHRKLISPAFNPRVLEGFIGTFSEKTKILLQVIEKNIGNKDIDVSKILTDWSLDTLFESTMGMNLHAQEKAVTDYGYYVETAFMIAAMRMYKLWLQVDFIFKWSKLNTLLNDIIPKAQRLTEEVIVERRKVYEENLRIKQSGQEIDFEEPKRKSFMDLLFEMSYQGEKFTDKDIKEEVDTIAATGTDTTATSLGFAFIMLGMFPDIQQKIYDEVMQVMGEERDIETEDLNRLKYLERFIKEVMRLFPVGALLLRKTEKDLNIGECIIPSGCSIFVGIMRVQRNPKIWSNPLKFDPDRFLPEEIAKRHAYSYLPFAGGPRNCIGHRYAMNAMKTAIAMVVRKFTIATNYKTIEEIDLLSHIVLRPTNGYQISFELRN